MTVYELEFSDDEVEDEPPCKGLIFRGSSSVYETTKGYAYKQEAIFLKRKSCPGCSSCDWLLESLGEHLSCDQSPFPREIEHGKLYQLVATNFSRDWESGIVDDWDMEFIPYEESN